MKKKLKVPKFKNEEAERKFWNESNVPYQSLIKEYIKKGILSSL